MKLVSVMVAACALVAVSGAQAQRAVVTRVDSDSVLVNSALKHRLDSLGFFAASGRLEKVDSTLRRIIGLIPRLTAKNLDSVAEDRLVSIVTKSPLTGNPALLSVLLSQKGEASLLPASIPGRNAIFHLYFTTLRGDDIAQEWLSQREASPLTSEFSALLVAALKGGGAYATAAGLTKPGYTPQQVPVPHSLRDASPLFVKVDLITMPDTRATLTFAARTSSSTRSSSRVVEGKGTLRNVKWERWSIGTLLGIGIGGTDPNNHERETAGIVQRPINGLITSAVVHRHFADRDPAQPDESLSFRQRLSVFGGIVVLPREGLTAGAAFRLWNGLGLHVSRALMRANRLPAGVLPDSLPSSSTAPFRVGATHRWNVGLSLALQLK